MFNTWIPLNSLPPAQGDTKGLRVITRVYDNQGHLYKTFGHDQTFLGLHLWELLDLASSHATPRPCWPENSPLHYM